jgi:glycosyltransferase involved in cell wall biosynthesis
MTDTHPCVDVNLFVYNGAQTIAAAIDSVLAQTWPAFRLTIIDNGSTDDTLNIAQAYADRSDNVSIHRNRANAGAVLNSQRAFWLGDADFVMPKTADDLLAPDFIERIMMDLAAHPDCAMCHAAGLVFTGPGIVRQTYPPEHNLHAIGPDRIERARHVMRRYTSAPSFWGIYRRTVTDRLARIPYRAGWDHAMLAELALYGEIRHVPDTLFWRRDGGKPVQHLAPACTEYAQRGLDVNDPLAELRWRTPLITTAYAHVETFALARLPLTERRTLMQDASDIFRARWSPLLHQEAQAFRNALPALVGAMASETGIIAAWMAQRLTEALRAIETILPGQDFAEAHLEIAGLAAVQMQEAAA